MALTHVQCNRAPAKGKPYKPAAGGGLYLLVHPNGQKHLRYKHRFGGKEKTLVIGVFPEVSITGAMALYSRARHRLRSGSGNETPSARRTAVTGDLFHCGQPSVVSAGRCGGCASVLLLSCTAARNTSVFVAPRLNRQMLIDA